MTTARLQKRWGLARVKPQIHSTATQTLMIGKEEVIVLRNYQKQLYDDIHNEWAKGARNVLAVAPTGSGKTSTFAKVIHDHPGASIAIAHRNELVSQISMSLARNGVRHRIIGQPALIRACVGLHVSELRRSYFDPDAAHGVAGVDTLVKRPPDNPWFRKVTLWVQDECFAAGTLVDGKPIESIRVGDIVTAFDEASGTFHQRPVTRILHTPAPENMVRIETKRHHVLYCTLGHPFWTKRGWVEAGNLTKLDEVLLHELRSMREPRAGNERSAEVSLSENGQHLLYEKVRDDFQRIETGSLVVRQTARPAGKSWVLDVWRALRSFRAQGEPIPENWSGLLQSGMLEQVPGAAVFRDRKQNEPEVCLGANAGQQPDAQGGKPGQGERDPEGDGAPADRARREREASVESGGDVGTSFSRSGLLCPTPNQDGEESREPSEAPALLQTRLGQSGIEDCAGGGWEQPQFVGAEGARCEKGSDLEWVGLDGIEVYQRGDSGTAGPSSDDGYVYNLEVAEFHTYVANGVVVHNCHHLLADNKWGKATALFPNAKGLGVTATPTRADGRGLGRHADGLMDVMVESPGMRDLIGMGFLTDYRIFAPPSDINLASVPISASGDFSPEPLRAAVHKSHIVGDVVSHYLRIAPGKLGVTFAVDVESATEIAAAYRQAGVPSEVVSANTPPALRAAILSRFARGELKQLLNVDLFGEGFDLPAIEVVGMARPTQSFALYCQQFGRSLRPLDGKSHAIIIDHVSNVLRHGLPDAPRVWTLDRRERRSRGKPDDVIPVRTCPSCLSVYERIYRECPFCGHYPEPAGRSGPEQVDGDLAELTPEALARLRGEIDKPLVLPYGATPEIAGAVKKRHHEKQQAQAALRDAMAQWGGVQVARGLDLSQAQRLFYITYGIDVASAQALGRAEAEALRLRVEGAI